MTLIEMARRQGASEAEANALKAQVEEVRTERDAWRGQAEEAMRQLAEQRRPGLLARLLGRGA
jgi:ATP/maltotriose-dependent transcriptional regulator MalT